MAIDVVEIIVVIELLTIEHIIPLNVIHIVIFITMTALLMEDKTPTNQTPSSSTHPASYTLS